MHSSTRPRGGKIVLGLERRDSRVRIYVEDTGPGISEQGIGKLFEVFNQVDETTTREYEGTGLGLALVKSLVEKMNGSVGVDSVQGQGVLFWADLPLANAENPVLDVLIVDDDKLIREMVASILKSSEHISEMMLCSSADEAIEVMNERAVRCVITDFQMAGRDGLSLLQEVAEKHPQSRRVLLTGQADNDMMKRAVNDA